MEIFGVIFDVLSLIILAIVVLFLLLIALVSHFQYCYSYWRRKGVPSLNPVIPFGDLAPAILGRQSTYIRFKVLYDEFKKAGYGYGGIYFFRSPAYMPVDIRMVKDMLGVNFDHFVDRGVYHDKKNVPMSYHLFAMEGHEWKTLRAKLTPTFTTGKMKNMYEIMYDTSNKLVDKMRSLSSSVVEIDIKDLFRRFTVDIICTCAFGIEANSLHNQNSEFMDVVDRIFNISRTDILKVMMESGFSNFGAILKVLYKDPKTISFLTNMTKSSVEHRKKNNVERNDLLNTLIELNNIGRLSFQEIVSQNFLFFAAGFETSSTTMTTCLHELAHKQDVQNELRQKIRVAIESHPEKKLTYDNIQNIPYLDNVIDETLRLHPTVPILNRICVKDYIIPDTNSTVCKGTPVIIPVYAIHRDSEYFENPCEFDPDRFKEKKFPPFSYLPFGEGPRNCIGKRFGLLQTKLGVARLVSQFKFEPSETVPRELTLLPCTTSLAYQTVEIVKCKVSLVD